MNEPHSPERLIGASFGNYRIQSIVGAGGMGTVYQAIHPTLNKKVAIKVLHPELAAVRDKVARLIDEARASTAIGHENIVQIFDCGESPDRDVYLVMEFLEGETLAELLNRKGRLTPKRMVGIVKQVCAGLEAAHRRGIIHRDIKPQNLFLARNPSGEERIKILDFGVAKLLDQLERTGPKTTTGAIVGTPYFMAPEQAKSRPVD